MWPVCFWFFLNSTMHGSWWGEAKTVDFSCYQMRGFCLKDCREIFSQPHKINKTGLAMIWSLPQNKRGWLWLWLFNRAASWVTASGPLPLPKCITRAMDRKRGEALDYIIVTTFGHPPLAPPPMLLISNATRVIFAHLQPGRSSKPCKIKQPHNWEFVVMGLILCNAQNDDPLWNTEATQISALSWANVLRSDVKVCAKKHQAQTMPKGIG